MITNKSVKLRSTGAAMVLALAAVALLLTIGTGMLALGMFGRILTVRKSSEITAQCAADAGLTMALFAMNEKLKVTPWDDTTLPAAADQILPNFGATFNYTVTGNLSSGYVVTAVGKSENAAAEKEILANLRLQGAFEFGILTQGAIILKPNTLVDAYNSSDANDTDPALQIGTCSTDADSVTVGEGSVVDGSILTGVDGYFPPITIPSLAYMGTNIFMQDGTIPIDADDNGKYTGINLKNATSPAVLQINGDVVLHITGDVLMGQSCEIVINPNSSLTIYLDGDFIAGNSAGINCETVIPGNFVLYGTGESQTIDLKAKGDFYGVVYAPNADAIIRADGNVHGAFVSSTFEMKSGGNFYYDAALRDVSPDDQCVHFIVNKWSEN